MPVNYYPDDDPNKDPIFRWRAHAHLLYTNWLNYYVCQNTPYDLDDLEAVVDPPAPEEDVCRRSVPVLWHTVIMMKCALPCAACWPTPRR